MLRDFGAAIKAGRRATFFTPPPQGRRLRVAGDVDVVLQRHRTREALVALTVVPPLEPIEIDEKAGAPALADPESSEIEAMDDRQD